MSRNGITPRVLIPIEIRWWNYKESNMLYQDPFTPIFECFHGSTLHGTAGPQSDKDIKGIYLCRSLDEYMLRRGSFPTLTPDNGLEGPDKVEEEWFYIQDMAHHLTKMQTNNVSMVFCPEELYIQTSPAWEDLVRNRHRLISKSIAAYAGYAKGQSQKYTMKGERLQTARDFLEYLQGSLKSDGRLHDYLDNNHKMTQPQWDTMRAMFEGREGVEFWVNGTGEDLIRVVAKSFSKTTKVDDWVDPIKAMISMYGERAGKANKDGQDIKAVYHALRIVREGRELLTSGELHYPSVHVPFYMKVRNGEFSYEYLQERITEELEELWAIQEASTLPEHPDREWLQGWAVDWQQHAWRGNV